MVWSAGLRAPHARARFSREFLTVLPVLVGQRIDCMRDDLVVDAALRDAPGSGVAALAVLAEFVEMLLPDLPPLGGRGDVLVPRDWLRRSHDAGEGGRLRSSLRSS